MGVALHRVGAQLAALTDGSPAAVHNCAANLRLNGIGMAPVAAQGGGGGGGQQPQLVVVEDARQLAEVEQVGWGSTQQHVYDNSRCRTPFTLRRLPWPGCRLVPVSVPLRCPDLSRCV